MHAGMPSRYWIIVDTFGKTTSGEVVPVITMSMSAGVTPASSIAFFPDSTHISEVV